MNTVKGIGFKLRDLVKIVGKTIKEDIGHSHKYQIDANGNGCTTRTEPKTHDRHVHVIKNKKVTETLNHGHSI